MSEHGSDSLSQDLERVRIKVARFMTWARQESGIDYKTIESQLFIPKEVYMKWESGEESPRLGLLFQCMKLFGPRYVREALILVYSLDPRS
ncbi:hypothetical protein D3C87_88920 [compost metagenome]